MNYRHLNNSISAASGGRGGTGHRFTAGPGYSDSESGKNRSEHHSHAHRIATSEQAKHNPVLAFRLIREGFSSESALKTLERSARTLSHFTVRKMDRVCPGWELMTDEAKNFESFQYGLAGNDSNGYFASMAAAKTALNRYIEPLTIMDFPDFHEQG